MQSRLVERWYRPTASVSLLQPLAWLYGQVVSLRRRAYRRGWLTARRAGKPVVVVGNLTVGGTGKTPVVAWLAQQLSAAGLRVGIVSRGYGRSSLGTQIVHEDSSWREVGDEPLLLRRRTGCDTIVARNRAAGAQQLVARGADVIIADDGLQHLRLGRDCEIIVIDGSRGFGNGRLLPAGPLREPVSRLQEASVVVVNGDPEHASLLAGAERSEAAALRMTLFGDQAYRLDGLGGPQSLEHFRGQRVHAVAGVGNPQRFFRDLRAHGMELIEHPFADHHAFVPGDLDFGDGLPVLITEKDAVRCQGLTHPRLWCVPVVARFSAAHSQLLLERVARALGPAPAAGPS